MGRLVLPFCGSFRPDLTSFTSLKHFCTVRVIDFLQFANESVEMFRLKLHFQVGPSAGVRSLHPSASQRSPITVSLWRADGLHYGLLDEGKAGLWSIGLSRLSGRRAAHGAVAFPVTLRVSREMCWRGFVCV